MDHTGTQSVAVIPLDTNEVARLGVIIRSKWNRLYKEKRDALATASGSDSLQVKDFDSFQSAMSNLCDRYQNRGFTKFITRLTPTLKHLSSFSNAITTASQTHEVAALVWSGASAVIEVCTSSDQYCSQELSADTTKCGCRFSSTIEAIIGMLSDMNAA